MAKKTTKDLIKKSKLPSRTASKKEIDKSLYIVGVGASAGGLEALETFFDSCPADTGLAFVIIQHLSPDYKSLMSELLARRTDMDVLESKNNMIVKANY